MMPSYNLKENTPKIFLDPKKLKMVKIVRIRSS